MSDLGRILSLAGLGFKKNVAEDADEKKMVCKDCGDEFGHPTTDCENSAYDKDGDHWIEIDVDGDGKADIKVADREMKGDGEMVEAVGDSAEVFYNMQDEFAGGPAEGAHKVLIDELVRYLSGDQLEDFCDDFKRHYDMNEAVNESEGTFVGINTETGDFESGLSHEEATSGRFTHMLPDDTTYFDPDTAEELVGAPDEEMEAMGWEKVMPSESTDMTKTFKTPYGKVDANWDSNEGEFGDFDAEDKQLRDIMMDLADDFGSVDHDNVRDFVKAALKKRKGMNEADVDENAFNQAAAAASRAGKKEFKFGGKTHKTTMKKDVAHKLDDDIQMEAACGCCDNDPCDCGDDCGCKESVNESPTMDTTQLITLLKNAGLSETAIQEKLNEWANTPDNIGEVEPREHGDAYDFAQGVNLSLKRYLDAENMKVTVQEHTKENMKALYEAKKNK